jgi:hypothetical protein
MDPSTASTKRSFDGSFGRFGFTDNDLRQDCKSTYSAVKRSRVDSSANIPEICVPIRNKLNNRDEQNSVPGTAYYDPISMHIQPKQSSSDLNPVYSFQSSTAGTDGHLILSQPWVPEVAADAEPSVIPYEPQHAGPRPMTSVHQVSCQEYQTFPPSLPSVETEDQQYSEIMSATGTNPRHSSEGFVPSDERPTLSHRANRAKYFISIHFLFCSQVEFIFGTWTKHSLHLMHSSPRGAFHAAN